MAPLPDYLLKLSISLAVVTLFYELVLRRLTFYQRNRWYLFFYSALCFVVPLVDIGNLVETNKEAISYVVIQKIPTLSAAPAAPAYIAPGDAPMEPTASVDWIFIVLITGMAVMLLRFGFHILSLIKIKRQSRLVSDEGDVRIYHFDQQLTPFSFGKSIFYNPAMHDVVELQDIILHEYIHVTQRHTVDVLWAELVCILNWYNPFAWKLSHAIRQNLEYIADEKVLENHADTKAYQYLLLKTAMGPEFRLAHQFGYLSLKKRIVMMNKTRSPRILLACFWFSLPLLALLLAAFRNELPQVVSKKPRMVYMNSAEGSKKAPKGILHIAGLLLDAQTGKPIANLPLKLSHDERYIRTIQTDADGFYFQEVASKGEKGVMHTYSLSYDGGKFVPFVTGKSYQSDYAFGDGFGINFLNKEGQPSERFGHYYIPSNAFYGHYKPARTRAELKTYLLKELPPFVAENRLKVEFRETHRFPKDVLTLYKTGYFDRKKDLVGYVGETKLYLDGKEATHKDINEAFRGYPYILSQAQERRLLQTNSICSEIVYLTFPLHRDTPPPALVKGNIEFIDASAFDLTRLKNEPYLLDGFRQVYGASSNLIPLKEEVKTVVLLKGMLARYYDPSLDKILWIETRPVKEVFERPDFAVK
ncbi:M56 family metallopeptidase [Dyadobacter sp. MSC1_007]|jgi:5-hydroxyisourate hydrolase-like protein (transthyretin family)|uniref:M56 family metallopeptidase n=1 Tax=Dyadobacter sp. MSC1_007 TaxID=2909264 RepID=UPI00202EC5CE|nr:M56 family metallopeptidase [Dyadobacter sp. MSC1_007]